MTESEILSNLAPGSPRRQEAAARLLELLEHMARRNLRTRFGSVRIVEEHLREEVIADVAFRIVEKSPLAVAERGDAASRSYLAVMLANRYRDLKRRPVHADVDTLHDLAAPPDEPDHEQAAEARKQARARLDWAVDQMIRTKRERDREGIRQTWTGLSALVFDEVPMWTLVDRELGAGATDAERRTVRNRFFKKHQYFREYLAKWLDDVVAAGSLDPEEARIHRDLQAFLIQCQTSKAGASVPEEGEATMGRHAARRGATRERTR